MKTFAIGAALAVVMTSGATALTVDATTWGSCLGAASCAIGTGNDKVTIAAGIYAVNAATLPAGADPRLGQQNFAGVKGLGVRFLDENTTNSNRFELQGPRTGSGQANRNIGEMITMSFAAPALITSLTLAHLYSRDQFSGDPEEVAVITASNAANVTATLTIQALRFTQSPSFLTTVATTLPGGATASVSRVETAVGASNAGRFVISNLFGELGGITQLVFKAGSRSSGDTHDYTVSALQSTPIPLPAGLVLALTCLAGAVALRRRKAQAA
jgi:hypothetical protein